MKDVARMEATQLVLLDGKILSYIAVLCLLSGATRH